MRTKLLGAFIAALAIAAFAALPSAAMATNVTLKEGKTTLPVETTVRFHSSNFTFKWRPSGLTVACATTSLRGKVRTNPGARITFRNEGVFQNPEGGDRCKLSGPGIPEGRLTFRVENVNFRKDITLQKTGTAVSGRTEMRFTVRFFDAGIVEPVAICNYDGTLNVTSATESDSFHAESETDAKLELEGNLGSCDSEVFLTGDFRLTRRDGTTAVRNN